MLKELMQSEIDFVQGRRGKSGCSCCCKRNPRIIHHEGIWVGDVDSESICLSICDTRKDSLGYMSCIDKKKREYGCSTYNNTGLADKLDFCGIRYLGIDTKKLREIYAH